MSEFRINPITGEYIILASERADRPYDFNQKTETKCPFCLGNEYLAPTAISQIKDKDSANDWDIRIIPNKYPFISDKKESDSNDEFFKKIDGYGVHDVFIDTPNHNESIINFSASHMENVFFALQNRQKQIEEDKNIKYVQIFKNNGRMAGASKEHSHWQIVGLPIVTPKQTKLIESNYKYMNEHGICGFCDVIIHEAKLNQRVITENEYFIAITAYAPEFPYEIWILPKNHISSFLLFDSEHIKKLSEIFQTLLKSLNSLFEDLHFNICFQDRPIIKKYENIHHWYLRILPRITGIAGFEWSTSCYIDTVSPELAAQNLKQHIGRS